MTHDDLQTLAWKWLNTRSWCHLSAQEVAFAAGRLDVVGVSHGALGEENALVRQECDAEHERAAARRKSGKPYRPKITGVYVRHKKPGHRLGVVEVKVSRADLLSDLRQRKMHQYSALASYAWLALTPECLLLDASSACEKSAVRGALEALDLPVGWGVLIADKARLLSVRPAKKIRDITAAEALGWQARIGRCLMYRYFQMKTGKPLF